MELALDFLSPRALLRHMGAKYGTNEIPTRMELFLNLLYHFNCDHTKSQVVHKQRKHK
jgi:hypothetical protein